MIDSLITIYHTLLATITQDIDSITIQAFIMIAMVFWIVKKISSFFESDFFRFLILILGLYSLSFVFKQYDETILFNLKLYVGIALLLPHIEYYIYYGQDKYYQMKYATINSYYFTITVYYKTIRFLKALIWFFVTLAYLFIWIIQLGINTFTLLFLGLSALYEKIAKADIDTKRNIFSKYWQWYKYDWEYQQEQRSEAKYTYRDWYQGTKFYFKNPIQANQFKQSSSKSQKNNSQSSNNENWQKQYEDWFKKNKSSEYEKRDKEQNSNDAYKQNTSNENKKSHDEKYARFFEGNYYTILGVQQGASFSEIKKAWKDLVNTYHPDRNPDNEKLFTQITQKINEAYDYFKKHNKNG